MVTGQWLEMLINNQLCSRIHLPAMAIPIYPAVETGLTGPAYRFDQKTAASWRLSLLDICKCPRHTRFQFARRTTHCYAQHAACFARNWCIHPAACYVVPIFFRRRKDVTNDGRRPINHKQHLHHKETARPSPTCRVVRTNAVNDAAFTIL